MDDRSFNIRVPKKWVRMGMVAVVTAMIVAPVAAFASHQFTDVPNSNTFHNDIAWLADAGVTKGCNPPANTEFCPDDPTTRGQMAAFMKRFAGYIGAEDGTPAQADHATSASNADNADTVDGLTPAQIASATADSGPFGTLGLISGVTKLEQLTVSAPASGYLQLIGSASFGKSSDSVSLLWFQVDDTTCLNSDTNIASVGYGYANSGGTIFSWLGTAFAEGYAQVSSGNHTVTLCGNADFLALGSVDLLGPSISAVFLDNVTITPGLHSSGSGDIPGSN